MIWPLKLGAVAAALAAVAAPAYAHHALTMYDRETERSLQGVVKSFDWTNPHIRIQLLVTENGKPVTYDVEAGSPGRMSPNGWKSTTLQRGDKITLTVNPLRSGEPGGVFVSVVLPDGTLLTRRRPPT